MWWEPSWQDYLSSIAEMRKLTKADVVAFARKWFGNNYTVVYKKPEDKMVKKVPKPEIHPVEVNRQPEWIYKQLYHHAACFYNPCL